MPSLPRSVVAAQENIPFHPFADIFPMMDEAALAELAADIKAESQREPIHLWQDQIIDGRNRYKACKLAGVEPVIKRIEFPGGEQEALAYVVSRNLKRRHLNAPQRTEVIRRLRELSQWRDASNREIARQIGVSEPTVRRAISASDDADAPQAIENAQPASRTIAVKRGEQEYRMRVQPTPESKPPPPIGYVHLRDRERVHKEAEERRAFDRVRGMAWLTTLGPDDRRAVEAAMIKVNTDSERAELSIKACNSILADAERARVIEALTRAKRDKPDGDDPDGKPLPEGVFDGEHWIYKL
jgi:hypothetical protein